MPSSASPDFGRPFAEIFARYDHDFYRIDPLLFSPAVVTFTTAKRGTASFSGGRRRRCWRNRLLERISRRRS